MKKFISSILAINVAFAGLQVSARAEDCEGNECALQNDVSNNDMVDIAKKYASSVYELGKVVGVPILMQAAMTVVGVPPWMQTGSYFLTKCLGDLDRCRDKLVDKWDSLKLFVYSPKQWWESLNEARPQEVENYFLVEEAAKVNKEELTDWLWMLGPAYMKIVWQKSMEAEEIAKLKRLIAEKNAVIDELRAEDARLTAIRDRQNAELARLTAERARLRAEDARLTAIRDRQDAEIARLRARLRALRLMQNRQNVGG